MLLDALKDIRISSSEGRILISAKNEIILTSGGGYIRIGDGTVECAAPDKIIERGAVWQKFSARASVRRCNSGILLILLSHQKYSGNKLANLQKIKRYRSHGVMAQWWK